MSAAGRRTAGARTPGPAAGAALAAAAVVLAGGGAPAVPAPADVGPEPGPAASADSTLEVERSRGYAAVPAAALPEATPVSGLSAEGGHLRAELRGKEIVVRAGSPFVRLGDRVVQLANPPYEQDGRTWVPAELVTRWLPAEGVDPEWRVAEGRLTRAPSVDRGPFRVVVDPGHGGRDPGAIGPGGQREKHVTLAVAREVKEALADEPRVEVLLTRNRDTLIALRDRSQFAVEKGADLFLSLHANAAEARNARGFETYFLSPARTEEAREVAMRENASVKYERGDDAPQMSDLQFILADLDQDINVRESRRLAGYAQNAIRPVHSGPDRGVKQAGFLVLVGASGSMPAVLVEMGFLTNPNEARVLTSGRGQDKIAESIADAVVRYFDQYRQRLAGASSR